MLEGNNVRQAANARRYGKLISSVDWFGSIGFVVVDRLCAPIYIHLLVCKAAICWIVYIRVLIVDSLMWMQKTFIGNRNCSCFLVVSALDDCRFGVRYSSVVMLLIVEVHACMYPIQGLMLLLVLYCK